MNTKVKTFREAEKYLKECGLNNSDFSVDLDINNIEFFTNTEKYYFISVGEYDNNTFEVFAHSFGAKWDENDFCIKDGTLRQYKIFKNLKKAIDFALKCLRNGFLPKEFIREW